MSQGLPADAENVFSQSLELVRNEVDTAVRGITLSSASGVLELIHSAPRLFVIGLGRSGLVLRAGAMRLMHLGLNIFVVGETTTPAIRRDDVLIAVSGSGTTPTVVRAAETALSVGATVLAVTAAPTSALSQIAAEWVIVPAAVKTDHGESASHQYSGSLFEQAALLTLDALFDALWRQSERPAEELWTRHANLE